MDKLDRVWMLMISSIPCNSSEDKLIQFSEFLELEQENKGYRDMTFLSCMDFSSYPATPSQSAQFMSV
ncbi:hypothetical protein KQX54_002922 [Cotesia glomerata]|uniref:Uncharacterized protein n=1 Tax=Cotesia glomerata TaxID=32391 RepID=A0AAV7J231_COTGL|nr:hypothetical protein KQX54_002922 [Cotesia glomerata]